MVEKRRATTFRTSRGAIVNVQYPDIYIAPSITTDDMRKALRDELGDVSRLDGIMGGTPLRVYPDTHVGIHFYCIAALIAAGELSSNYFPESLSFKPRVSVAPFTLTPYSYDLVESTLRFSGSLVAKGYAPVAYGMMRTRMRFVERVGTKSIGLMSYPHFSLELTPTTFRVITVSGHNPPYATETETTNVPYLDTYSNALNNYTFYLYPNLAMFMIGSNPATLVWHTTGVPNAGTAPVFNGPTDSEMRVQWVDFAAFTDARKWQPPPLPLWTGATVPVAGAATPQVPAHPYSAKTFYLISNQGGTVTPQIDWGDGTWRNLPAENVTANVLWYYQSLYDARFMRLNFVPLVQATVSARALLRY